ncbi:MAG: glycosyltransferase [Acholeplasmatales bacterium]|nr:glycosyltransferase [Acholeplasmatales bacterium]
MKISVILCIYKEPVSYIKDSIDSILSQSFSDFEFIIVIDNPLNKDAIDLALFYENLDKRIKCIFNNENLGLAMSLNKALSIAKGDYIARMDADDISFPNRLNDSIKFLEENDLDLIGGVYENIDCTGKIVGNSLTRGYNSKATNRILKFTNIVPHPTWFGKKEVFDNLSGYRLVNYAEDYDFLLRAINKKCKIAISNFKVIQYRVNTNGISQGNLYKQFLISQFLSKHRKKIEEFDDTFINTYSLKKYTLRKEKKFFTANSLFLQAKEKSGFKKLLLLIKSFLSSSDYRKKYYNMIRKRMICITGGENNVK